MGKVYRERLIPASISRKQKRISDSNVSFKRILETFLLKGYPDDKNAKLGQRRYEGESFEA